MNVSAQGSEFTNKVVMQIDTLYRSNDFTSDSCLSGFQIRIKLSNNGDSTLYFSDPFNVLGYNSVTFEIQDYDSLYIVSRAKRLWWRGIPSFIKIPAHEYLYLNFSVNDSSCAYASYNKWIGLPSELNANLSIRVVYHPPTNDQMNAFYHLIQRRNYRDNYCNSFSEDTIVTPHSSLNDLTKFYRKSLMSIGILE